MFACGSAGPGTAGKGLPGSPLELGVWIIPSKSQQNLIILHKRFQEVMVVCPCGFDQGAMSCLLSWFDSL